MEPVSETRPGRVLIVDDTPANVRLLEGILKVAGHQIITASDGAEALERVGDSAPDVILLDVMMPGMDGFEVCRRIKSEPATSWLPVVMVTALQETTDRVRAIEVGADDFLTKPVDEVEVEARVKSLVAHKRQREQLETAYSDLRRAEAMRESLTAMIVHDLRTPLTGILGSLETMKMVDTDSFQRELIEICSRSGNRLLTLINDLLDISKMESGQMKLARSPVPAGLLINEALDQIALRDADGSGATLRVVSLDREIKLRTAIEPDLPFLNADRNLLSRVLVNLLGNAVKFEPSGGVVTVGARLNSLNEKSKVENGDGQSSSILFSVRDNGPGIAREDHKRIFDKFGQVEARQAKRHHSTGLGLTFCKLAVEAHGGKIWVESELGQGSEFFFAVPLDCET